MLPPKKRNNPLNICPYYKEFFFIFLLIKWLKVKDKLKKRAILPKTKMLFSLNL